MSKQIIEKINGLTYNLEHIFEGFCMTYYFLSNSHVTCTFIVSLQMIMAINSALQFTHSFLTEHIS